MWISVTRPSLLGSTAAASAEGRKPRRVSVTGRGPGALLAKGESCNTVTALVHGVTDKRNWSFSRARRERGHGIRDAGSVPLGQFTSGKRWLRSRVPQNLRPPACPVRRARTIRQSASGLPPDPAPPPLAEPAGRRRSGPGAAPGAAAGAAGSLGGGRRGRHRDAGGAQRQRPRRGPLQVRVPGGGRAAARRVHRLREGAADRGGRGRSRRRTAEAARQADRSEERRVGKGRSAGAAQKPRRENYGKSTRTRLIA